MNPTTLKRSTGVGAVLLAALLAAAGCSKSNSEGVVLTPRGTHPAGWATTHPDFARPDGAACVACHGSVTEPAQSGGISKVSCFSAPRGAQWCHAGGPAFHPPDWLDKGGTHFHRDWFDNNTLINGKSCGDCHTPSDPPSFICLDCHFTVDGGRVPPGSNWSHGQIAGHSAFGTLDNANPVNRVCIRCHEINNAFGHMPQPFCHNCHSPAPPSFHPAGWGNPDAHGAAAKLGPVGAVDGFPNCRLCHGANFAGGDGPSCINNTACHGSSADNVAAGPNQAPHSPRPWNQLIDPQGRTHTDTATDNATADVCGLCHRGGANLVTIPPPPPQDNSVPNNCFNNTLCHDAVGAPHPLPYLNHQADARARFATFCSGCHNIFLPRKSVARSCVECHKGGDPLTVGNCATCHGNPPDGLSPVGNVFPNIEGAHTEHNALAGVAGICSTCHNGGGTGTGLHHFYDNVAGQSGIDVALAGTTYQARAGAFAFNANNNGCANVSCHGGITTPSWRTGTIAATAESGCRQCHTPGTALGTPENNSPYSGQHQRHEGVGAQCVDCHDMTKTAAGVQNHFAFLATAAMEGPARDTLQSFYNTANQTCTLTCHINNKVHNAEPWFGGG